MQFVIPKFNSFIPRVFTIAAPAAVGSVAIVFSFLFYLNVPGFILFKYPGFRHHE